MDPVISSVYEKVMARLLTILAAPAKPEIKHIDLYFGQYLEEEAEPKENPYMTPAVLFAYDPIAFKAYGNRVMAGDLFFDLHVVHDTPQEQSSLTAPLIRAAAQNHLVLVDKIKSIVKGYNDSNVAFNSIAFLEMVPYMVNGIQTVHILKFRTRVVDRTAKYTYTPFAPSQVIETEMTNVVNPNWILFTGFWNDAGYWYDTAEWKD